MQKPLITIVTRLRMHDGALTTVTWRLQQKNEDFVPQTLDVLPFLGREPINMQYSGGGHPASRT